MLFTVISIENENNTLFVTGSTSIGYVKGVWKDDTMPVSGGKYQIELEFSNINRAAVSVSKGDAGTKIIGSKTAFSGICEEIDEVYYIRFSVDGLAMLDILNDDGTIKKGDCITFSLPFESVGIYPILKILERV